jgi:predicted ABC-type ATPase
MDNKDHVGSEIEYMRTLIQLIREQLNEDMDIRQLLHVLDAVGKAATRLATLIKAQQSFGEEDTFANALAEAVREVVGDFKNRG